MVHNRGTHGPHESQKRILGGHERLQCRSMPLLRFTNSDNRNLNQPQISTCERLGTVHWSDNICFQHQNPHAKCRGAFWGSDMMKCGKWHHVAAPSKRLTLCYASPSLFSKRLSSVCTRCLNTGCGKICPRWDLSLVIPHQPPPPPPSPSLYPITPFPRATDALLVSHKAACL